MYIYKGEKSPSFPLSPRKTVDIPQFFPAGRVKCIKSPSKVRNATRVLG
ncbi:hypothetical protein FACS1894184_16110 [Clostridia bacterium]|nr:hypothetical protein FACS1894184_16110 [Clostridia bacterium]